MFNELCFYRVYLTVLRMHSPICDNARIAILVEEVGMSVSSLSQHILHVMGDLTGLLLGHQMNSLMRNPGVTMVIRFLSFILPIPRGCRIDDGEKQDGRRNHITLGQASRQNLNHDSS